MPRNKKYKPNIKDLKEALTIATKESLGWQTEARMLRKQLDNASEARNYVQAADIIREPFLKAVEKQQIKTTFDLVRFVGEIYEKGKDIINRKNRDYGDHLNQDPFGNFRRHELKGFLVRIDDKLARLNTFANSGKLAVLDESVLDSIIDACNYLAIMAAYIYANPKPPFPKDSLNTMWRMPDKSDEGGFVR